MPLLDCLERSGLITKDRAKELHDEAEKLSTNKGIHIAEAEAKIKNDFVNEEAKRLNTELNALKKELGIKQDAFKPVKTPDFKALNKQYQKEKALIDKTKLEKDALRQENKAQAQEEVKLSKSVHHPVQEFVSKQGHTLKSENGAITVLNKDGKEVSRATRKKVTREAAESYDFTQGKEAPEPDFEPANDIEFKRHVIENSQSPSEIAALYINEQPESAGLATKEQMIADYGIGKVTEASYNNFGDRNNKNNAKARAYFSKNGTPMDSLAKEIGDHYDVDITPEDVKNFIDRFPNGADAALSERESKIALSAKDRFSEITGLPLDEEIAGIAIKQQFNKLSKQEQDIAQQDYETRQQLEDEYWKQANRDSENGL
ncbi:MAG: hypothetical protein WKF91_21390, partial [Segetibacter sp.]